MLDKLVDIVKRIPAMSEALGLKFNVEDDGKTVVLNVAGTKVNAVVDGGKLTKISVDLNQDPEGTLKKITDAIGGTKEMSEIKPLEKYLSNADTNPDYTVGVAVYGERFLYGGYTVAAAIITDHDKYIEFKKESQVGQWTKYMDETTLFSAIREIVGLDVKMKKGKTLNLTEILTGKHTLGDTVVNVNDRISVLRDDTALITRISTDWCDALVYNYYPKMVNQTGIGAHQSCCYNWVHVYNELMKDHEVEHGLVIGMNPNMEKTVVEQELAKIDNKLLKAVDAREDGPLRTISGALTVADTIAMVAYTAQLTDLSSTYNLSALPVLPSTEKDARDYYDKYLAEREYDVREAIVKLEYVIWD